MSSRLRPLAFVAGLLLLSSCGGTVTPRTGSAPSTPPSTTTVAIAPSGPKSAALEPLVVHIRNFAYVPAAPVVALGQPIEIINDDVAAHTWSAAPKAGWAYTSGNLEKGQRATFPGFSAPGRYKFLCYYHAEMPSMNGVVSVKATP